MADDNNKDKKRENPSSQEGPSAEVTIAAGAITTNVGYKEKKILDTGDVSRASIAKGIRSPDDGEVAAADIVKGTTNLEDMIHTPQEYQPRMEKY
jgi:inosine-uridine nucleoside N-ribohydrolase